MRLPFCGLAEAMHRALLRLGEVEGRRTDAEKLLVANEKFRLADSSSAIRTFDLDIEKNAASDADTMRKMFGLAPGAVVNPSTVMSIAFPDDVPRIKAALGAAFDPAGDGFYGAEYRIRRANDGAERWIAARGQVCFETGSAETLPKRKQPSKRSRRAKRKYERSSSVRPSGSPCLTATGPMSRRAAAG
jgi:hypothetical protein